VHGDMHGGEARDRPNIPFRVIAAGVQPNAKIHAITFSRRQSAARCTSRRLKNFVRRGCHTERLPVVAPAQLTRENEFLKSSLTSDNFGVFWRRFWARICTGIYRLQRAAAIHLMLRSGQRWKHEMGEILFHQLQVNSHRFSRAASSLKPAGV
jgi:hypothetical protein